MSIDVVIADDSTFLRKVISNILSENNFINVVDQAKNGKEAVEKVKALKPDVLVLDLIMPEMNGLDALKVVMNEFPLPTIILSAVNPQNMDASMQALLLGAFDYIIKPGGLGAKDIPLFQKELVEKVLLASKSGIKRIFQTEKEDYSKIGFIRQQFVRDTFEFGLYLKDIKPIDTETFKEASLANKNELEKESNDVKTEIIKIEEKPANIPKSDPPEKPKEIIPPKPIFEPQPQKNIQKPQPRKSLENLGESGHKIQMDLKNSLVKKLIIRSTENKEYSSFESTSHKVSKPTPIDIIPSKEITAKFNMIVMGASVGGPRTIKNILKDLPGDLSCPIVIVQHLTDHFIETFARSLNESCKLRVKVAENGEIPRPGVVYIAPGSNHLEFDSQNGNPCFKVYKGQPVHFCMPSIDVLFLSAAKYFHKNTLAILLTGMGEDGVEGLAAIQRLKGRTIAEAEETCILYGMPKFAAERGVAELILPNYRISEQIRKFC